MSDTAKAKDFKSKLDDLEKTIEEYMVVKAPFAIPENIKELIVKFGPWITVIMMIMLAPILLGALGLSAFIMPLSYLGGVGYGLNNTISLVLSVVIVVMDGMALPGLFNRTKQGWKMMFYVSLVSIVQSLFTGGIVSMLVSTIISWYVIFQVKSYYK